MCFKVNNFWVAVLCPLQWLALRKRFDGTAVGEFTVPDVEGWWNYVVDFWDSIWNFCGSFGYF